MIRRFRRLLADVFRRVAFWVAPRREAIVESGTFDVLHDVEGSYGAPDPVYVTADNAGDLLAATFYMAAAFAACGGYANVGRVALKQRCYAVRFDFHLQVLPVPAAPDGEAHGEAFGVASDLRQRHRVGAVVGILDGGT